MPGVNGKQELSEQDIMEIINIDRFRPSLHCDLFIPSYVHSLSIATEFIYNYVLSRFPKDYFNSIHVVGKHPFEDFRKLQKGNLPIREVPSASLSYSIQYDFNDNMMDWNLLSTNKYLKKSQWQRSFFKCPHKKLYIGMDLEAMMVTYTFRFREGSRSRQLDLYNRLRKIFRIGCTETVDIDCDFHLDPDLMFTIAKEAGFNVDESTKEVLDPWNFVRFLNSYSQMPILYRLRLINQRYEYFLRMRNLPVHLDMQNALDVDEGNPTGMINMSYIVEMQIETRFPCPRTFALYNEGKWKEQIKVEDETDIKVYSMKVVDIPEENYKHWPMYGHSDYISDTDTTDKIEIKELFRAPIDVKTGTSLEDLIQDAINQCINPDVFVDIAVYSNDIIISNDVSGRLPIQMDWENRTIKLPTGITSNYFYIAIYIDRFYINNKVIERTGGADTRIAVSKNTDEILEERIREVYHQEPVLETYKPLETNTPKPLHTTKRDKARFVIKV